MGAQLVHAPGFGAELHQRGLGPSGKRPVARARRLRARFPVAGDLHDVQAAARTYSRGQKAGTVAAEQKAADAAAKTPDAVPADPTNP